MLDTLLFLAGLAAFLVVLAIIDMVIAFITGRGIFAVKRLPGFATIAVLVFAVLYAPIAILVIYSFNEGTNPSIWVGFSTKWYTAAMSNEQVQEAALRSIFIALIAASVATIVATMAALATTRTVGFRGMVAIYSYINLPLMVPEIVTAVALLIFFASIKINTGYTGIGYMVAAHTAFCIPFAYLPIRARLESMDLTLERAAADLYATPWKAFRRITLPLMWPGIIAGLMLAFVVSLDDVVITEFVKSAGQETLPTFMLGQLRRVVTPEMFAISTLFLAVSIAMVSFFFFINRSRT